MIKPDFNKINVYNMKIFDINNNLLHKGFINLKAWNKIIENNEIWEFFPENQRVIAKDFYPLVVDLKNISIQDDTIIIKLIKEEEKNNEKPDISKPDISLDNILFKLEKIIKARKEELPEKSYTAHLFEKGEDKILKKLGEEAIELILAAKSNENIIEECADLLYHLLVLFVYKDIKFNNVFLELYKRMEK